PVDVGNTEGLSRVADAIQTPVATGESVFGTAGFGPLIEQRAASVLIVDLQHCGGPTGFVRVAAQAESANLPVCSHLFTQASVHLLAVCRTALMVEYMPGWWDALFDRPLAISDGRIRAPGEPGIGFQFSRAANSELIGV